MYIYIYIYIYINTRNTQIKQITKFELCNLYIIQNKKCHCLMSLFAFCFTNVFELFENFDLFRMDFRIVWGMLFNKSIFFVQSYSDYVYSTIYGNMVQKCFFRLFEICSKNVPEV